MIRSRHHEDKDPHQDLIMDLQDLIMDLLDLILDLQDLILDHQDSDCSLKHKNLLEDSWNFFKDFVVF